MHGGPHISNIIAVDGGGTGCRAAVANRKGVILGRAEGGPANIATGFDLARQNIMDVIQNAWAASGMDGVDVSTGVCVLGLAGANIGDQAIRLAKTLPFANIYVTDDRETTFQGALMGHEGCLAVIGTGSFYCGQVNGVKKSIGGWGFLVGDDGSGARLGQDLLRRVLQCQDTLKNHSELTRVILQEFANTPADIAAFSLQASPADFGGFAIPVVDAARAGDVNGLSLLRQSVAAVQASIECVGFTGHQPVCMLGGLGKAMFEFMDPPYRDNSVPPKGDALTGGIAIARHRIGDNHAHH